MVGSYTNGWLVHFGLYITSLIRMSSLSAKRDRIIGVGVSVGQEAGQDLLINSA